LFVNGYIIVHSASMKNTTMGYFAYFFSVSEFFPTKWYQSFRERERERVKQCEKGRKECA